MTTNITTANDLATWIHNTCGDMVEHGLADALADAIRAEDHPRWGSDWSAWLDSNYERIARAVVASLNSSDAEPGA